LISNLDREKVALRFGFDPFGDDCEPEPVDHRDDGGIVFS